MAGWEKALDEGQIAALIELLRRWDEIPSGAIPAPDEPVLVTVARQGKVVPRLFCRRKAQPDEGQHAGSW